MSRSKYSDWKIFFLTNQMFSSCSEAFFFLFSFAFVLFRERQEVSERAKVDVPALVPYCFIPLYLLNASCSRTVQHFWERFVCKCAHSSLSENVGSILREHRHTLDTNTFPKGVRKTATIWDIFFWPKTGNITFIFFREDNPIRQ